MKMMKVDLSERPRPAPSDGLGCARGWCRRSYWSREHDGHTRQPVYTPEQEAPSTDGSREPHRACRPDGRATTHPTERGGPQRRERANAPASSLALSGKVFHI